MRSEARGAPALPVHVIGNVNLDIVMGPVTPWPEPGSERIVESQDVRVGGAAGVAAMALQALSIPFRLHARIGDDAFGRLLRRRMAAAGMQLEAVAASTAYSLGVTHPAGERTFFTHLGHLAELDVDAVAAALERSEPGLVLVCGYFLLPPLRRAGQGLMRRARQAGHRVLFDTGWPSEGFTAEVREELDTLLPWIDMALPNEAEAHGWTGQADLREAARALQRAGARVVIKCGAQGACWLEGEALRNAPAPEVRVADSVGAGDCFNAALLAALSTGADLAAAATKAVAYAASVVARSPRRYAPDG